MSRRAVTFVKSDLIIKDFVGLIADKLKTRFVPIYDEDGELYQASFLGLFITIYENEGFDDEGDLDFSNFDLVLSIGSSSPPLPVEYKYEWPEAFSVALVSMLRDDIDGYMVTDDVERVVIRG